MENPVKEMVMEGAAFAKENGCDFIVALGGGAVLDSAVAVAAMATNPGDLWDRSQRCSEICGGQEQSVGKIGCECDHRFHGSRRKAFVNIPFQLAKR